MDDLLHAGDPGKYVLLQDATEEPARSGGVRSFLDKSWRRISGTASTAEPPEASKPRTQVDPKALRMWVRTIYHVPRPKQPNFGWLWLQGTELDSNKELYLTRYVVEDPLLQRIYSQYDEDSKLLEKLADRQRTKRTGTSARQKSAHSQSSQYRKFTPAKGWGASPEPPPIIVQLPPRFGNEIKGLITDALKVLSLEEKKRSETGAKIAHYALVFLDITNLRKGERNQLNKLIIEHLVEHLDTDFINSFDVFQKIFNDLRKFW
ncbi:hypothetical protein MJO29_004182 [Puccinia striiformis f. sp. tritici]|uniref:Uncharacterized protein n=3 Tax=Puccinia striiformis TaxID=27350 RepID=A0A0L0VPC0_9BASI|nr:hypothetical protein MJO29_004182 [Puccinia striiformis f. sp. tritici]KNF01124.1 hypothetical protein PSTG_05752 [Puccinia striiformis f. sp. tritici PST-78]POW12052.1 hypothetical protein PSTT_04829 [Puccinia striiformis]